MSEFRDAASVILHSGMSCDAEDSNENIVDEEVVVIAPRKRKQRSGEDVATPPTDGDLHITVHIISVNATSTAFSKTKRNISFTVSNAGESLENIDHIHAMKNIALQTIRAEGIHIMVINFFGGVARENLEKIRAGNEPRLLNILLNTTNPDYNVRFLIIFSHTHKKSMIPLYTHFH
jgi:hypothetical protein